MEKVVLRLKQAVLLGGLAFAIAGASHEARAQSVFCPLNIGNPANVDLNGGFCTDGTDGAFSNAALAAQALSDVSQSSSLESTQTALAAISARRRIEIERCPDGFERVNGECQRIAAPAATPVRRPVRRAVRPAPRAPVYKAPVAPVMAIESARRYAVWARGFGDYERRSGSGFDAGGIVGPLPGVGFNVSGTSRATSWGLLAGVDRTFRTSPVSGFILGLLAGYIETDARLSVTSVGTAVIGTGTGTLNALLRGATVGAYATYFDGGFSADLTFKVDFLDVGISFTDTLAFGPALQTVVVTGSGSTDLTNFVTVGNVNYRFPAAPGAIWIEPTAGFNYTVSRYSSGAATLGLANGEVLRVQGGARFGIDLYNGTTRITPSLTGLAYTNAVVSGGFVTGGVFSTTAPLNLGKEGQVNGQGILAVNIDNGAGLSGFVQGDVRGGKDVFGYGGKAGIRVAL